MNFDIEDEEEQEEEVRDEYADKQKIHLLLIFFFAIGTLIVVITLLVLSSGKKTTTNTQTTTPPQTITPTTNTTNETKAKLTVVNEDSNERPIAVMIDNTIGQAPHAGLQDSYLNYEIPIDGGVTRIMAVFKDTNATLVGPIRSSIYYFIDYALENDAIYVHYGLEDYEKKNPQQVNISRINGVENPDPFRRDSKAIAPHNVFSKLPYIKSFIEKTSITNTSDKWQNLNYSTTPIDLTENTSYNAKQAAKVTIPYSETEIRAYSYDTVNNYYLRYTNGQLHKDRKTSQQFHYKNVIIQRMEIAPKAGDTVIEAKTVGSGTGYYITNGKFLPIKWTKSSREGKTSFTYEDGTEVLFNDGNTFIQIVPTNANITIE